MNVTENVNRSIRIIQGLDPNAHLCFSRYTGKWFVSARIEITNGTSRSGIAEHRENPQQAVLAFLAVIQDVDINQYEHMLVTMSLNHEPRYWKWNGAAFAEERLEVGIG